MTEKTIASFLGFKGIFHYLLPPNKCLWVVYVTTNIPRIISLFLGQIRYSEAESVPNSTKTLPDFLIWKCCGALEEWYCRPLSPLEHRGPSDVHLPHNCHMSAPTPCNGCDPADDNSWGISKYKNRRKWGYFRRDFTLYLFKNNVIILSYMVL